MTPKSDGIPVMGSSMNLIGAPTGTTWAMASSVVSRTSEETPNSRKNSLINTPRILELDVNRMLIGQNSVRYEEEEKIKERSSLTICDIEK